MIKKLSLLAGVVVVITLFFYFDLAQHLSLESLKENKIKLQSYYQTHPWQTIFGFIGIYIVAVAFSIPSATILTLSGGAIFGVVKGMLIVNVGATLGATLAFLAARFLLRDWVETKFGDKLQAFNEGFSKNAINYILFLRLVPLFPFFLINLISGLTQLRLSVYFFGTLFGTLPAIFVYANAGSHLASIESLKDIASPGVLGAFALLGLFALIPTFYKKYQNKNDVAAA